MFYTNFSGKELNFKNVLIFNKKKNSCNWNIGEKVCLIFSPIVSGTNLMDMDTG